MSKAKQDNESTMNLTMPKEVHTKLKVVCMTKGATLESTVVYLISEYVNKAQFKPIIEAIEKAN